MKPVKVNVERGVSGKFEDVVWMGRWNEDARDYGTCSG